MKSLLRLFTFLALSVISANAGILMVLDSEVVFGKPGDTLAFRATITNTGDTTIYLNSDSITFDGTNMTLNDLFGNTPLFLDPGVSAPGVEIIEVLIDADPYSGSWGPHLGTYQLVGGADGDAQDILATVNFDVEAVPEPATAFLWLPALGGLLMAHRRRKQPL